MSLAARLAPYLSGVLMHPGDENTEPFQLAPLPVFQRQSMLPAGMAEDDAKAAGLPHPDFALIWLEAVFELIRTEAGIDLDDPELAPDRQADLRAAAAVREPKRNQVMEFHTPCGQKVRAMARGFDTGSAEIPCALVVHQCEVK